MLGLFVGIWNAMFPGTGSPPVLNNLLLEDGTDFLLEDGTELLFD